MLQYHFTNPDTLNDYGPGMPFEEYVKPLVEFQFLHNNKRMFEGDHISRDYEGRVTCVGSTYISYNYYGQVTCIGDIYISYDSFGRVNRVGGLYLTYDYNGNITQTTGKVRNSNVKQRTYTPASSY